MIEFVFAVLGYGIALGWQLNPWLIHLALPPLALYHRALSVHKLKVEAQTDAKTGLWNARQFSTLFASELERAQRFHRPAAVIMADLDLLRNINNTYGHLAGDTVLAGVGRIIKDTIREYNIAGRFGGEEFAIVLPEVSQDEAYAMAERVRLAIEVASFEVSTSPTPLQATMSVGIACFPADGQTGNSLIHAADVAVYQDKIQGRNRVVCNVDVPQSVRLEHEAVDNRLDGFSSVAFTPRPAGATGAQPELFIAQPIAPPDTMETSVPLPVAQLEAVTEPALAATIPLPRRIYILVASVVSAALGTVLAGFATVPAIKLSMLTLVGGLGLLVFVLLLALLFLNQRLYTSHAEYAVCQLKHTNEQLAATNRETIDANTAITHRNRELQGLNSDLQRQNDELFVTLARLLDARDPFVDSHSGQVATYAAAIATELELMPELHHLRSDDEWRAVFHKLFLALKPGGSLWISDLVEHNHAAIQALMWERYGAYLSELRDTVYRDQVFAYIAQEDTPRPLLFQLDLLRSVGFAQVELLHKNSCFAAFGAIKER